MVEGEKQGGNAKRRKVEGKGEEASVMSACSGKTAGDTRQDVVGQ